MGLGAVGGAVLGGVASAATGSLISGITAGNQSGAISTGQQQANAVLAPYSNTGVQSNTQTANLIGLNGQPAADSAMSTFQASPGYQYQVQQGLKAVDAGAASQGLLRSGATLKAEQTLGNNLADQDFGNYVSRLNSLSNFGITAAGGQASTDTSAAGNQASIYGNEGENINKAIGGGITNSLTALGTGGFGGSVPSGGTGSGGNLDPYTGLSYMNA
jgi:hypothetical protein